jgi:hypothetical protein
MCTHMLTHTHTHTTPLFVCMTGTDALTWICRCVILGMRRDC